MQYWNRRLLVVILVVLASVVLTACTGMIAPEPVAEGAAIPQPQEVDGYFEINPDDFSDPTTIDNKYLPLKPGTHLAYEGFTVEDDEEIPHEILFTVTDLVKEINGIPTVVIWERDIEDDELIETELAFYAQDDAGNVWYLGEYTEVYEEEEFVGGKVWLVGHLDGAKAGIKMFADPQPDTPSYSQGFAPEPYNWTDHGQIYEVGQETCVPADCYEDVIVIDEFNEEEPGAIQLKYYAPGVGNVRIGWRGDDTQQETMELVEVVELDEDELAEAREEALELETRAYVYGTTPPAEAE